MPSPLFTCDALGIVEISLSTPSSFGISGALEGGEGHGIISLEKKPLGGGEEVDWSMELESQLFPSLAGLALVVAPGKGGLEELDFSHAARVAGSTGQTSAEVSESFAMML
jgi:hypothetical protein